MMLGNADDADLAPRPVIPARHALRDQEALWAEVLEMAAAVEDAVALCVRALSDGWVDRIGDVRNQARTSDAWRVRIDRECLRILALYEPVASDLRRLSAVLRINADLERISKLARNIAKRIEKLAADSRAFTLAQLLAGLGEEVLGQVRNSFEALTRSDARRARAVVAYDDQIDRHYHWILDELKDEIRRDPGRIDSWLRLINTARNLERIADHAVQIAEAVVYVREGAIIRHHKGR